MRAGIPQAALDRFNALQSEEASIERSLAGQVGTSVPHIYYATDSVIVNPSNVGIGMLSRMVMTDDTVFNAITFKTMMVVSKVGEYHHDKAEIKDFVNDFLRKLKAPTWKDTLASVASSTAFGFSVSEVIYGLDKHLRKVPIRIPTYHPSTIAFEVDPGGLITPDGVIQYNLQYSQFANPNNYWSRIATGFKVKNPFVTPTDRMLPWRTPFLYGYGLVRIPRNKVIHHVANPGLSFGDPYGVTGVRSAHLFWQLKVFLMKQMGIAAKRNSTNTLWGTAPMGQTKVRIEQRDGSFKEYSPLEAMREMLGEREQDDAIVTGPESAGYKVNNLSNQADLDKFLNAINACDIRIFRCFLLPSLVMTDGSAGSRSLGDKHFQIVDRICEIEADSLGETVVNDVLSRVIQENFGEQDDYGKFTKRPQSIEERLQLAQMFLDCVNGGILKNYTPGDIAFMRSSLHLPDDEDPGFDLDPSKKPGAEPAPIPGQDDRENKGGNQDEPDNSKK